MILSLVAIGLAILVGLAIPLSSGGGQSTMSLNWTPPATSTAAVRSVGVMSTPLPDRPGTSSETSTLAPIRSLPTATITPSQINPVQAHISTDIANLRSGPGAAYGVVGTALSGEVFEIIGRSADEEWVQLCCFNGANVWVAAQFAKLPAALKTYKIVR
jgi:uncharacterized protein YgiM (DUF1202 family)